MRALANLSHQSIAGFHRLDPSNANKVVLYTDFREFPYQKPVLQESPYPFESNGRVNAAIGC